MPSRHVDRDPSSQEDSVPSAPEGEDKGHQESLVEVDSNFGDSSSHRKTFPVLLTGGLILLVITVLFAFYAGRYGIEPLTVIKILFSKIIPIEQTWSLADYSVVMELRFPRIIAAILVGAALSIAGATYQGVFRNPLVAPDILGVSSGASVGAAIAILLNLGNVPMQILAFLGGLLAVGITLSIPALARKNSVLMLVLAGIITGGFFNAVIGLLKYIADPETQLPAITYWMLGSVANVTWMDVISVLPIILICFAALVALSWRVNLLSLGDAEARSLGANVRLERIVLIIFATLITAGAVCIAGSIGWIGLVIPHLIRLITGADNVRVIPLSALGGAIFMLLIDTLARTVSTGEIPLSILTGFIGTPIFAWVLIRQRKGID